MMDHPDFEKRDVSSLRLATTGATVIPVDLIRKMHEVIGIDHVYSAYGLTETCGVVSLCQKGDDFETIATTVGRPLPETEVILVDEDGNQVITGEEGEIWVRGFNAMQGYLDAPEDTARTITSDGWLKTGDVGTMDEKGYLRITDRKKDMIIVGGFNAYPAEIEKWLMQHPDVIDAAVIGMADDRLGEVPQAFILSRTLEIDTDALITWVKERISNFKVPRKITVLEDLPRNASGKVQKFLLEKM
jgi:acyl-CoA synthetase (AMP-forming)/AMP-acid ligase II